jgi:hypothetical protein
VKITQAFKENADGVGAIFTHSRTKSASKVRPKRKASPARVAPRLPG